MRRIPGKTHVVNLTQNTIEANARFFASMDDVPKKALTMGIGTIMKAKKIVLLANGAKKAQTSMVPFMVQSLQSTSKYPPSASRCNHLC